MLDFYIIKKDQPTPSYPEKGGLELIGELDDKTFDNLQNKGIIDQRFDYYSDFKWNDGILKQIRQNISDKNFHEDVDVKKLIQLLEIAEKHQCDLIAYGD